MYNEVGRQGRPERNKRYLVTELAENGELFNFVQNHNGLQPAVCRQLFGQLLNGLHTLHNMGIAHRDMKPENCFLDASLILKVADFGTHKVFAGDSASDLKTCTGTRQYMAPEVAKNERKRLGDKYQGPPVDIFACGIILFFMLVGEPPFLKPLNRYHKKILSDPLEIREDEEWNIEENALDLVAKMIAIEP